MFKIRNGYCNVNTDDVQRIVGIPNRGREALQSTRDLRIPKPKENRFVDKYFSEKTRIARKLPWSLAKNCNSTNNINQYNWAEEIAIYLMESINRIQKRKRDKQPTVSGTVVLLLMDNAKQILESVEHCPEDDDDDFVEPPPASKKRKMEKQVAKNGLKAKKAKALKKLVIQHEDLEEVETVVGPEQVANKDETVVAPKLLKGDADDEMIDIQ
ncbi:hypothetical protein C1H46_011439 [Malus baccata]|uniref:Uncharacterized protein n=1 Tax=Malus baccata TaxID=106549 RepID=A0A540MVZ5_MALBA|nr:hypothetical protein C1H46_011439 [Malus baccata]